jgi:hypothetical protein
MAWRIVKQPSGKYARFSDIVDDFTHYNLDREEVVSLCRDEGLGVVEAEAKVQRADDHPQRYAEEMRTIEILKGPELRKNRETLLV